MRNEQDRGGGGIGVLRWLGALLARDAIRGAIHADSTGWIKAIRKFPEAVRARRDAKLAHKRLAEAVESGDRQTVADAVAFAEKVQARYEGLGRAA